MEKTKNVLVLKQVIRRMAVCPDEIYRVNPRLNLWFLLNQTYLLTATNCRIPRLPGTKQGMVQESRKVRRYLGGVEIDSVRRNNM